MARKLTVISLVVGLCLMGVIPGLAQKSYSTLAEYEKLTGKEIEKFNEAPMLKAKVAAGELPPVEERLPKEPLVVEPLEEVGQYGGIANALYLNPRNWPDVGCSLVGVEPILGIASDARTIIPNIARDWEFSKDGRTLTLYLRKGIKWSDGTPFTTDDIMFWYEDIILNDELTPVKPKAWSPGGELMKMEKVDDYTISLQFAKSYPIATLRLAHGGGTQGNFYLPKHYLKNYHPRYTPKEGLEKLAKSNGYDYWYQFFGAKRVCGFNAGLIEPEMPVLRSSMVKKRTLTDVFLQRNPYYWKIDSEGNQLPYIDEIRATLLENVEVANMKAIAGEMDFVAHSTGALNYPLYKGNEKKGNYRTSLWDFGWGSVLQFEPNYNHKDPILRKIIRDRRFRIALSLGINREEINQVVFSGFAKPRQSTVIPQSGFYEEKFAKAYIEYDPKKANELLDEIGLKWDKKHEFRLRPDGKTLAFTIEYRRAGPEMPSKKMIIELVKEYWENLGVKIALKPEARALLDMRCLAAEHDMTFWNTDWVSDILFPISPRRTIPVQRGDQRFAPLWGLWYETDGERGEEPPEEIKRCLKSYETMQTTMDEKERIRAGREILRSQAENLWVIGTVGLNPKPILTRENLRNFPEKGIYAWDFFFADLYSPEQFFFKQGE